MVGDVKSVFERKIRTRLDLLSIPQSAGEKNVSLPMSPTGEPSRVSLYVRVFMGKKHFWEICQAFNRNL